MAVHLQVIGAHDQLAVDVVQVGAGVGDDSIAAVAGNRLFGIELRDADHVVIVNPRRPRRGV
jgi:hypothetical protein